MADVAEAESLLLQFLEEATGLQPPTTFRASPQRASFAAAVEEALTRAQEEVLQFVTSHRSDIDAVFLFAEEIQHELRSLKVHLEAVLPACIHRQIQQGLFKLPGLKQQLRKSTAVVDALRSVMKVHLTLQEFSTAILLPRLVEAAAHLKSARNELALLQMAVEGAPLCSSIVSRCEACEQLLVDTSVQCWSSCWTLEPTRAGAVLELRFQVGQTTVSDLLLVLRGVDRLCPSVAQFANTLLSRFLKPLLSHEGYGLEVSASPHMQRVILEAMPCSSPGAAACTRPHEISTLTRLSSACGSLTALVRALRLFLVGPEGASDRTDQRQTGEDSTLMCALGDAFWSEMVRALCHDCLLACWEVEMQQADSTKEQVTSLVQAATETMSEMDQSLRRAGLARFATCASFAAELQCHAAKKYSQTLLRQTRLLLLDETAASCMVGGSASDESSSGAPSDWLPILHNFSRCRVSMRTIELARLLRRALVFACSADLKSSVVVYSHVRNLIELFVAAACAIRTASEPLVLHTTLLMSDDCAFLACCCISLDSEHTPRLPAPLCAHASLVDLAAMLREESQLLLHAVFSAQRDELVGIVEQGGPFSGVGESEEARWMAKSVLRRLEHQLRLLPAIWTETVPSVIGVQNLERLVETAVNVLLGKVQSLRHISERDCSILQSLLHGLCSTCEEILRATDLPSIGITIRAIRHCREVEWILGARLSQIRDRYLAGEFNSVLSCELMHLLRAMYDPAALQSDQHSHFMALLQLEMTNTTNSFASFQGRDSTAI
ncbi:hypothetical protein AB1Y20_023677 [Prymnesium parvum]|uniref:Uncharacterized protein n=1 Tax=Prymnesium parvum TaxID=97485 RepID=A0AB34JHD5_PRYPA|mmetsp:Transcript_24347/g.60382  ORF Transcript_24347/g.60382 Transcript_24347/m.60382 type:complete len:781 (-) Transcript_24347:107-2449(-)